MLGQVFQQNPTDVPAHLLADALVGTWVNSDTDNWADVRLLEAELLSHSFDRLSYHQLAFQELTRLRFFTAAGKARWQSAIAAQLLEEKKTLEKLMRRQEVPTPTEAEVLFGIEEGIPARGVQTFFRTVYRNHINLSAIADNKANIMISVNSILISVLITFLSYRNIAETQPMILLPVIIFLVTGLASLVFAVLSARPKVTNLNERNGTTEVKGLAFFGNFVQYPLGVYTDAMDELFTDSTRLYRTMSEDLYHLGKVLDKKYRYLTISYNTFMVGLVVTVGLFLFTLFS
ncbi:MAG: DUF5706 domain-containing protein [Saprospiraceae bacterium]